MPTACLGWHCCSPCRAGDAVLGLTCLAALAALRAMKSRLPQAAPAEPLPVRISYLIVWVSATGLSAVPCPVPSCGLISAPVPLPHAQEPSAVWILISCPLPLPWAAGRFHRCSLHFHSTQCSRCPVCWPGGLLLPGDGLPALQAHGQHPPGPPTPPATALLPGSAQRHRPLPEHGAGGCWHLPRAALPPPACAGSQPALTGSFPPRTWGSGWPWCRSWACWRPSPSPRLLVGLCQGHALCSQGVSVGAWGAGEGSARAWGAGEGAVPFRGTGREWAPVHGVGCGEHSWNLPRRWVLSWAAPVPEGCQDRAHTVPVTAPCAWQVVPVETSGQGQHLLSASQNGYRIDPDQELLALGKSCLGRRAGVGLQPQHCRVSHSP